MENITLDKSALLAAYRAGKPPRIKIWFKTNKSQADDKSTLH